MMRKKTLADSRQEAPQGLPPSFPLAPKEVREKEVAMPSRHRFLVCFSSGIDHRSVL